MFTRANAERMATILKAPLALLIVGLGSAVMYSVYAIIPNASIVLSTAASGDITGLWTLVTVLVSGYHLTIPTYATVLIVLVSIAAGVNMALTAHNVLVTTSIGLNETGSLTGMAVASVAPGCAACATGAITVAGFSTSLSVLPFGGEELNAIALLLLITSAFWIVDGMDKKVCDTSLPYDL